jgi:hypothetical protein
MRLIRPIVVCVGLAAFASGCGGSQSEAKEPSESAAEEPAKSEPEEKKSEAAAEPKEKEKEAPAPAEPENKRSLEDILTREDVMYSFSFNASEPYQEAEKKCDEKAKDDPKKKSECMSKASAKFDTELISFEKDKEAENKYWYVVSLRKGDKLTALHKIPVDFGEEKGTSITIKPTGKDKGTKPSGNPKEITIDVPSESEIVITDPTHGKMVYQAKMGMKGR